MLAALVRCLPSFAVACCALPVSTVPVTAQCDRHWLPGDPRTRPGGEVLASVQWDPDGAGPMPGVLAFAGRVTAVDRAHAGVVTFDGTTWAVVGELDGPVHALVVHNGQLHAATGLPAPAVRVWNGSTWQSLGAVGGIVNVLASHNGELVAAGQFASVGATTASSIARWNGSTWAGLATGVTGEVRALALFGGALYVGGLFTSAGGVPAGNFARWNGSSWTTGTTFSGPITAFAARTSIAVGASFLVAGGQFSSLTHGASTVPAQRVARFDPAANTWSAIGTGPPAGVSALHVRGIGTTGFELVAGVQTNSTLRMWRWDGAAWVAMGAVDDYTSQLRPTTIAFFGGQYRIGLSTGLDVVRSWSGSGWPTPSPGGIRGYVVAVEPAGNDVVIAGQIFDIDGVAMGNIARGSAGAWAPLGSGVQAVGSVQALATAANGDLFAGGSFTSAGGIAANNVARWNGTAWSGLGAGVSGTVRALLVLPGGDLIAGGSFATAGGVAATCIARWNGAVWSPIGGGISGEVRALALLPDGSLVAAGGFTQAGGAPASRIARFHNGAWSPLGAGCNGQVNALALAPNGDLHAAGEFTVAGTVATRLAFWRNGVWMPTFAAGISNTVHALAVHPSGDLFVAGGAFQLPGLRSSFVRVPAVGGPTVFEGVTNVFPDDDSPEVLDVATIGGDVVIGGYFDITGPLVSANFARLRVPCPATAVPYGTACAGLGGPFVLAALRAPWLGRSWHLRAATFAANAFGVRAVGTAPLSLPLAPLLPGALPGCTGLVLPILTELLLPVAGVADIVSAVPVNPSLVGAELREQVLQVDVQAGGTVISASNGLLLTVGVM